MTSNGTHLLVNLQNVWNNEKKKYTFYKKKGYSLERVPSLLARFMQNLFIHLDFIAPCNFKLQ